MRLARRMRNESGTNDPCEFLVVACAAARANQIGEDNAFAFVVAFGAGRVFLSHTLLSRWGLN